MKNFMFTKSLAVIGMAVLSTVVLFGSTTASGAVPAVAPPGNDIAPSFTGVNVSGNIVFPRNVTISNPFNTVLSLGQTGILSAYAVATTDRVGASANGNDTVITPTQLWKDGPADLDIVSTGGSLMLGNGATDFMRLGPDNGINAGLFVTEVLTHLETYAGLSVKGNQGIMVGDNSGVIIRNDGIYTDSGWELPINTVGTIRVGGTTINSAADANPAGAGALKIVNGARSLVLDTNEVMSIGGTLYLNHDNDQNVQVGNNAHRSALTVSGLTTLANGLNVTGNTLLGATSTGALRVDSFESRGPVDARNGFTSTGRSNLVGTTTAWDLDVPVGATLDVAGDINLPFSFPTANISFSAIGNHRSAPAVCPAGKNVVACAVTFSGGRNYVTGPGTVFLGNTCFGDYYQTSANRVTGLVQASCL